MPEQEHEAEPLPPQHLPGNFAGCDIFTVGPLMRASGAKIETAGPGDEPLVGDGVKQVLQFERDMVKAGDVHAGDRTENGETFHLQFGTGKVGMMGTGNLTTRTTYDATTGLQISTTTPAGGTTTNTPRTTQTVYYSAAANAAYTECGGHAEWANLPCEIRAGGDPSSGAPIPVKLTTYNLFNEPETVTEKTPSGTTLRTTTTTYDTAGRPVTVTKTASTGTALPVTKYVYEASIGLLSQTQSLIGSTITAQITRYYDTLGRITWYGDADGNWTGTTYDLLSRVATVNDGQASQTRTYDDGTERRARGRLRPRRRRCLPGGRMVH